MLRAESFALIAFAAFISIKVTHCQDSNNRPEDCGSEQYYDIKEASCKNCSDIYQLFHSYQEWLGREVGEVRRYPGEGQENNRPSTSSGGVGTLQNRGNKRKNQDNQMNGNRNGLGGGNLISNNLNGNANNEVLSRLISVDPQDQESIDSFASLSTNDQLDDANEESPVDTVDSGGDIIKTTRQTLKLVNRFIQSSFLVDDLPEAINQCKQNQNVTACQIWSNLCVMTMYSHTDIPSVPSGNLYSQMDNRNNDKYKMSWQKCSQFNLYSICNSLRDWHRVEKKSSMELQSIYASDIEPQAKLGSTIVLRVNQPIQLLAYKYSYYGNLISVDQFGLHGMSQFCFESSSMDELRDAQVDQYIKVGQNLHLKCQIDLNKMTRSSANLNDTIFVDLFIGYSSNGATFVKPIPILIKNLIHNGAQINRKYTRDSTRWKLVHRFFFRSSLTLDSGFNRRAKLLDIEKMLIYPQSALLDIKFKKQERGIMLNSILLTLDYGHSTLPRAIEQLNSSAQQPNQQNLNTKISVIQSLADMSSYKKDLDLAMTILGILSSIWSLIKCYNLQKCYGSVKLDLNSLLTFIIISCDTLANIFATLTLIYLSLIFLAVKFQFIYQMLPPGEDLEEALITNLQLSFYFKLVGLLYRLYTHLTVDIFFIDWEKPKMLTSSQILNQSLYYDRSKSKDTNQSQDANSQQQNLVLTAQQSSFWRTYTIVNRWLSLQTHRRESLTLQLIIFTCIAELTQLTNWATADPSLEETQDSGGAYMQPVLSVSFRILILSFIYVTISFGQIALKRLLYEPMMRSKVREFVDLCSVANVSMFCMLHPRYGYYVHGRNANGSGDCSISEMNALLEREERDLCSKRGLAPNSDQQTFIIILPKIINDHYRKLLFTDQISTSSSSSQLNKQITPNLSQLSSSGFSSSSSLLRTAFRSPTSMMSSSSFGSNRAIIETIVTRNKAINLFLTNFLEHVYRDIDYTIRGSRRFESFLLDIDFNDETSDAASGGGLPSLSASLDKSHAAATFCADHNDGFASLLWLGLELDFILMELLTILIIDLWLGRPPLVLTVALVWFLHNVFQSIYVYCARQNLITKAQLDEKFLVRD